MYWRDNLQTKKTKLTDISNNFDMQFKNVFLDSNLSKQTEKRKQARKCDPDFIFDIKLLFKNFFV